MEDIIEFNSMILDEILKSNPIGEGSSREIYRFNNYIIKKSKNKRGKIECSNEYYLYENIDAMYKKYLCPVIYYDDGIIVMQNTEHVNLEEFNQNILSKHENLISYLYKEFGMDDFDLKCHFNWGKINENYVLIDYGHHYFDENLSE